MSVITSEVGVLDPVVEDDLTLLWTVAANRCPRWLRLTRSGVPTRMQFEEKLWREVLAHFIVRLAGQPVVYLSVHRADLLGRTAWVEAIDIVNIDTSAPAWLHVEEAFLEHVFSSWSLRFLICEHMESVGPAFDRATPMGRQRAAVLHRGEWVDTLVSRIERRR